MITVKRMLVGVLALVGAAAVTFACSDDGSAVKESTSPTGDSGSITPTQDSAVVSPTEGGPDPDGGPTDCVQNPQTHEEIINACTTATRIPKMPTLPLLLPDGGLPPMM